MGYSDFRRNLSNSLRLALRRSPIAAPLRRLLRPRSIDAFLRLGRRRGWDEAARAFVDAHRQGGDATQPLLQALRTDSNLDLDLELLLVAVRRRILLSSDIADPSNIDPELLAAVVAQSSHNSYVWAASDSERVRIEELRSALAAPAAEPTDGEVLRLALLATYMRPDLATGGSTAAVRIVRAASTPSAPHVAILRDLLAEREDLHDLQGSIECFGTANAAPTAVSELYETHPYPRWVALRERSFVPPREVMAEHFDDATLAVLDRPFNLLIAGCGIGYEAVHAARTYPHARITAIDLSRASLAYATLMARKHEVSNVRFIRMDLHDLPGLGETFDLARSIGVLHHLPSPVAGGRALAQVVRPGGILHVSLYSTLARRELARLRSAYGFGPGVSDDDLRRLRYRVMDEDPESIEERIPLRADFFDLDRCRDLLCHPLEHTFTVPELAALVDHWGLEFRGLSKPPVVRSQYWTRFPPQSALRDWEAWDRFERRHPDAFGSLYQIWLRKP